MPRSSRGRAPARRLSSSPNPVVAPLPYFLALAHRLGFRRRLVALRLTGAGALRDPGGQPAIVCAPRMDDHHALVCDNVFADIFTVVAAAHFDDDHHLSKLAIDLDIAKPDK